MILGYHWELNTQPLWDLATLSVKMWGTQSKSPTQMTWARSSRTLIPESPCTLGYHSCHSLLFPSLLHWGLGTRHQRLLSCALSDGARTGRTLHKFPETEPASDLVMRRLPGVDWAEEDEVEGSPCAGSHRVRVPNSGGDGLWTSPHPSAPLQSLLTLAVRAVTV